MLGKDVDHLSSCAAAYWCQKGMIEGHVIHETLEGTD